MSHMSEGDEQRVKQNRLVEQLSEKFSSTEISVEKADPVT